MTELFAVLLQTILQLSTRNADSSAAACEIVLLMANYPTTSAAHRKTCGIEDEAVMESEDEVNINCVGSFTDEDSNTTAPFPKGVVEKFSSRSRSFATIFRKAFSYGTVTRGATRFQE